MAEIEYKRMRASSQKVWDEALEEARDTDWWDELEDRIEFVNWKSATSYTCVYGIHPDDDDKADFDNHNDRGLFGDSLYRCNYFGHGEMISKCPIPIPNKPITFIARFGESKVEFTTAFNRVLCFNCPYGDPELPTGFYCKHCMEKSLPNIKDDNGNFDIEKIVENMKKIFTLQIEKFENSLNILQKNEKRKSPVFIIEVYCYSGLTELYEDDDEVCIRIILLSLNRLSKPI